jgi:hypothetical protein
LADVRLTFDDEFGRLLISAWVAAKHRADLLTIKAKAVRPVAT